MIWYEFWSCCLVCHPSFKSLLRVEKYSANDYEEWKMPSQGMELIYDLSASKVTL